MSIFKELVGQEAVKRTLERHIQRGNLPQALIFSGPAGVGRTTAAKILAKTLHGSQSDTHPDTFWFAERVLDKRERKIASPIKETADEMVKFLSLTPMVSKHKIAIVDIGDDLSEAAQNTLLKTLEEPRANSLVILVVSDEHRLLPTIVSRAQVMRFVPLNNSEIKTIVPAASDEIVRFAGGSIRRVMQLTQGAEEFEKARNIYEFWMNLDEQGTENRLRIAEELKDREEAIEFLEAGIRVCRTQLLEEDGLEMAEKIEQLEIAIEKINANANLRLALDAVLLVI